MIQTINSTMKIQFRHTRIFTYLLTLLLLGGVATPAWAYNVTYHVLTLPFTTYQDDGVTPNVSDIRTEAIRVFVTNGSTVALPDQFKSPLATGYTYYASGDVTKSGSAQAIYKNHGTKYYTYTIKGGATPLTPGSSISEDCEIYVTYSYDNATSPIDLNGGMTYNISMGDGFLAFNRGRNNRVAVVPKDHVSAEQLVSEDFVYVNVSDVKNLKDKTYWKSNDNKNLEAEVKSQFYFLFKYEGNDPYNITIRTAYNKNTHYIEKWASDIGQVNKYYKGARIFSKTVDNKGVVTGDEMLIASDDNKKYTTVYTSSTNVTFTPMEDYFRKLDAPVWNSFALLNAKNKSDKYVFMASKTVKSDGDFEVPANNQQYFFLQNNYAVVKFDKMTVETAANNYATDDEMYEPEDVYFKVVTPFGSNVTASIKRSRYTIEHDDIKVEDIPSALNRKYINYTGRFYKDAALETEITKYSEAEGNTIYVGYEVSNTLPFKTIKPAESYTTATWYELTDFESDQSSGRKLKWDGTNTVFKNNGGNAVYDKLSEFAFVGDPYELRVLYRNATETAEGNRYVGGSSPLGFAGAAYTPNNSSNFTYGTNYTFDTENLASGKKTLIFTISGLNGKKKIKVTKGGTDGTAQVESTTPTLDTATDEIGTIETITVTLNANAGTAKTMTVTVQEYESNGTTPSGTPTVITINQLANAYSWEIPVDETDGSFVLQQYGSNLCTTSSYWKWDATTAGNDVALDDEDPTRIKVMNLPEFTYTYNVVDLAGNIAIKGTATQPIFTNLAGYTSIPEVIRSPFLADEDITFYDSYEDTNGDGIKDRRDWHYAYNSDKETYTPSEQTPLTQTPPTNGANIFVAYTTSTLTSKSIKLIYSQQFNVKLNGEYIYWDSSSGKILSNASATTDVLGNDEYLWHLRGRDPYAMRIDNVGASVGHTGSISINVYDPNGKGTYTTESVSNGMFVRVDGGTWGDDKTLTFIDNRETASHFVAMMSNSPGVYEVLAATGTTDYYHIGRPSTENAETKVYSVNTAGYAHEDPTLRFELAGKDPITYHLIDKAKSELVVVSSNNPRLALPSEYLSPLVETYYYYPTKALADADVDNGDHTGNITEPDDDTDDSGNKPGDNHVYVTYTVKNTVKFNDDNSPYLLKFKNGRSYKMEDGSDKLTTTPIKAIYPYTNGDGNLNIYGQEMNDEQMNGGSSTRSRWTWFFDSKNDDPYHVTIHSQNKITYNGISHPTYLQTYAVHFYQDTSKPKQQHVVTGGALPGIASTQPTEYMILGTEGNYKLRTTNPVSVDLDGDGNTIGDGENVRQYVNSFEQYWKTYNMVKLSVLGLSKTTDEFDNDESTWVVPEAQRETLKTRLNTLGIGGENWHSYDAIANATRWNGYNDKSDGHEKKVVEKLEHWYQTFDMGDGSFDIESADIPPVLVLLDRHGWEIMRKPLPKYDSYPYGDELTALKAYDSPLVKEYKFYSNAQKGTGCHKYALRMQNGAERDQIKVGGKQYTSSSLAKLPPRTASGVISNGVVSDLYVTYTVKEEYENSYKYHLELHEEDSTYTESGTASKFLIIQNGRYHRKIYNDDTVTSYLSKPITEATNPSGGNVYDMILTPSTTDYSEGYHAADHNKDGKIDDLHLWYIQPNLNIDKEMGIKWAEVKGQTLEPHTEYEMKKEYKDKTGFDPYNIQLKNAETGKYLTADMNTTALSGGIMVGDYTGGGSKYIYLQDWVDVKDADTYTPKTIGGVTVDEGYDHTNLKVTNQTFMAVSDANGNMQLMPRFDHTKRVNVPSSTGGSLYPYPTTLEDPVNYSGEAQVDDNSKMGPQTAFFVRPQVIEYHILDNDGQEALRYKRAGEHFPAITEHFKSPLATDFTYYFDHAASTTFASNKESYTAAGTSGYFKQTATSDENMANKAKLLEVVDDYYFKVTTTNYNYVKVTVTTAKTEETDAVYTVTPCSKSDYDSSTGGTKIESPVADDDALETAAKALTPTGDFYYKINTYDYKKITVTKAYVASPKEDATYTTTECKQAEWENAAASQKSEADEAAMQTAILSLAKGTYYYQLGSAHYAYKKVVREDGKYTITITDASTYDGAANKNTATDEKDLETKAKALSDDGDYYYKVGPLYNYQKVVVSGSNGLASLSADIAAGKDISDREITGSFGDADLTGMTNDVYVRYSYDASADELGILQGKWFTINLAGKDVKCGDSDAINTATGTGVSLLQGTDKPTPTVDGSEGNRKWQWKFLVAPIDQSSELHESPDPYAIQLFNRQANYCADMREPNPMRIPIKVNTHDRFSLLSHPDGGYALAVNGLGTYSYDFLNGASMDTDDAATTANENRQKIEVENGTAYTAAKNALTLDGEYYYKYGNGGEPLTYTYKKVTKDSETLTENEITEDQWASGDTYHFNIKSTALSAGAQLLMNDDVTHTYTYYVINNDLKQAVNDEQAFAEASENRFTPTLPYNIQSPLLNMTNYLYYGSATKNDNTLIGDPSDDTYEVVDRTKLFTLYGLYDDRVYVRYNAYSMDETEYKVPNQKTLVAGKVAKGSESKDAALNISDGLPYNIVWENDNMMRSNDNSDSDSDGDYIKGKADQSLQSDGTNGYVWKFRGNDPYALKIYNGHRGKYIQAASASNGAACTLTGTPTEFMLLKRENYEYGVFEMTGHKGYMLTIPDDGNATTIESAQITTSNPKYFIIFGLSTHRLIYHLAIAKIGETVEIPYSESNVPRDSRYDSDKGMLIISGTTQRDLSNPNYQLGTTIFGESYSFDAGEVSIGDVLRVPAEFSRPNCEFFFYVDNIQTSGTPETTYQKTATDASNYASKKAELPTGTDAYYYFKIGTSTYTYKRVQVKDSQVLTDDVDCTEDDYNNAWQDNTDLNNQYKGLEITKLMPEPKLIGGLVKINIGYAFQTGLDTNAGEGFVTSIDDNMWYTFETQNVATPYLAHYTNVWGLQSMEGRETRYTNDYLWSPVGDVYGFKMYNRYMIKNSGGVNNVMTTDDISEGQNLKMAESTTGREVYELLGSNEPGYFRIHPVINYTGTQYYVWKDPSDNYTKLSTNYSEWTFNLPPNLLKPYIERVGYVGGLTKDAYDANKTDLDKVMDGTATYEDLLKVQGIVYDDENIVKYKPGYYRLHNQPDVSEISPIRYASGYLHKTELTPGTGTEVSPVAIPMHFYSKSGVSTTFNTLETGFTSTNATRGDIPIVPTEQDPSTIFYFNGAALTEEQIAAHQVPTSIISTQGLYVAANPNGDSNNGTTTNRLQRAVMSDKSANAITFSLMDIGGAVLLIHDGTEPATRKYLNFDQSNFFQRTATDNADYTSKKSALTSIGDYYFKIGSSTYKVVKVTALTPYTYSEESSNETDWNKAADIYDLKYYHDSPTDDAKWCMQPVQKSNTAGAGEMPLTITTNNGGDDYYYATFCAPFDVLLPADAGAKTYNAYICKKWHDTGVNPTPVPKVSTYNEGKFVPAGTPVIIRTSDESGSIKLALPSSEPTPSDPVNLGCVFSGKYLEQMLTPDATHDVYTLGLQFTTPVEIDRATGAITAELPEKANNGVGFYINANPNKENNPSQSLWFRNNNYVLHNKIYYRAGATPGASAPQQKAPEFVPVIFDDEEEQEMNPNGTMEVVGDGCIYDLMGRKVATREQVEDGSWWNQATPGVYILNGRKVIKK